MQRTTVYRNIILIALLSGAAALSFFAGTASALQVEGEQIASVNVIGNRTVSDVMIFNKLETREKGLFSEEMVKEDVKRLYELGYFTNISVDVEKAEAGVKVAFVVKEKPELKEIVFRGNEQLPADRLKREMKSKVGEALNEKLLVADIDALAKLYAQEGFPVARVAYEIVNPKNEPQAVALIKISEGSRQAIRRIRFAGNTHVPTRTLAQLMETKRRAPWPLYKWPMSYLYSKGQFDEEALNEKLLVADID
ncbi:MAG: hypothetical protein NT045_08070, partial [Candidatus Aureabacteria bacterium]|nr:hypothetical protein [Candidatus Auribacterota bacterium]